MNDHADTGTADHPLEDSDAALLDEVAQMYSTIDPVPDDLVERVQFALALDEVYDEVARMSRVPDDAMAVRGPVDSATQTDSLTFSAERLTAMVTVSETGPGRLRIDGWVAPEGARLVTVRMQGKTQATTTDESGRFVLEDLRSGFVQLRFHPLETATGGSSTDHVEDDNVVVTPLFKL